MSVLQLFVLFLIVLVLVWFINMIRKGKMDLRFALSWILGCGVLIVLDLFPGIIIWFAGVIGIEVPSNMIFLIAIFFILVMIVSLTASVSQLSERNKRLTQEVALLKDELKKMKEKQKS